MMYKYTLICHFDTTIFTLTCSDHLSHQTQSLIKYHLSISMYIIMIDYNANNGEKSKQTIPVILIY